MPQKGFGILEFEFSVFPPSKLPQFWGLGLGKSAEGKPKTENSGFPRFLIMNKLESALLFTLYIYRERARERESERERKRERERDKYTYIAIPNVSHTLL